MRNLGYRGAGAPAARGLRGLAVVAALEILLAVLPSFASAQGVFLRGDCDESGRVDITDAINLLGFLFLGEEGPNCLDACDGNDDERLNLSDAIASLDFLFLGGRPFPPPFPHEGVDPSGEALDCSNGRLPYERLRVVPALLVFHGVGQSEVIVVEASRGEETLELGDDDDVIFSSDDPTVVSVDDRGRVTASGAGETAVRARFQGVEARGTVRVLPGADGGPALRLTSPRDGAVLAGPVALVSGIVRPLDASVSVTSMEGGELLVDTIDSAGRFHVEVPLAPGENEITLEASSAGDAVTASVEVTRVQPGEPDAIGPDGRSFPVLPRVRVEPADDTPPEVRITSPEEGAAFDTAFVAVEGTVDDPAARVRVNGVPAAVEGGVFTVRLQLRPGRARIEALAVDPVGNETVDAVEVEVGALRPRIGLEEPAGSGLLVVGSRRIEILGTVDPPDAPVTIEDLPAGDLPADVNAGTFRARVELEDGIQDLVITARAENGGAMAQVVRAVLVDRAPPQVEILHPPEELVLSEDGYRTAEPVVTIAGRAVDAGAPVDTREVLRVSIGGRPPVEVSDGFAIPVALEQGVQRIELAAEDARGNRAVRRLTIERLPPSNPRLVAQSGSGQTVEAGSPLPLELVASAIDGLGAPRAAVPLVFRVLSGSGVLTSGGRMLRTTTGPDGEATVSFVVGREAGVASQVVEAMELGRPSSRTAFVISTRPGSRRQLVRRGAAERTVGAGETTSPPLAVRLLDAGGNAIAGAEVEFRFVEGPGSFPGGREVSRVTDTAGVASAGALADGGEVTSLIKASASGAPPLAFRLRSLVRGAAPDTTVAGTVLDDLSRPVAGAPVRAVGTGLVDRTDGTGAFELDGAPSGEVLLEVSASPAEGFAGPLRFRVPVVAGRKNILPDPLRLPRFEPGERASQCVVSERSGGVLVIPSLPGFRLEIPPGSVIFPDGSRTGVLGACHPNVRAARGPLRDGVFPDVAVSIVPESVRFTGGVRLALPAGSASPGESLELHAHRGAAGGWFLAGGGRVDDRGFSVEVPPGTLHGGGILFVARPGPPGGSGSIGGALDVPVPRLTEAPQRDESFLVGFQVYAHSGEFFLDETDLVIPGRGLSYRFRRRYESRHSREGSLGWNWEHEYADRRLYAGLAGGNIVRADGAGRFDEYLLDHESGEYVSPVGVFSRLFERDDGFLVERLPDGTRYLYHPLDGSPLGGRLASITDRHGNRLAMARGPGGRLEEVADPLGRRVRYDYDGAGRIDQVVDFAGRVVDFEYDERGDLVAVTSPAVSGVPSGNDFPDGKRTEYVYRSGFADRRFEHNLLRVIDPREVAAGTRTPRLVNVYREDPAAPDADRVVSQLLGGTNDSGVPAGGTFTFEYLDVAPPAFDPAMDAGAMASFLLEEAGGTRVTDPAGVVSEVRWSGAGLPLSVRVHTRDDRRPREPRSLHPAPGVIPPWYETSYRWSVEGLLEEVTHPRGNRVEYVHDLGCPLRYGRANVVLERRHPAPDADGGAGPPEVIVRSFDPLFARVVLESPAAAGREEALRRATRWSLDYEEDTSLGELAAEAGVDPADLAEALARAGIRLHRGDLNADGATGENHGSRIVETLPRVRLPDGTEQEAIRRRSFNRFGQLVARRDAEGVVTRFEYHPESDPDGDGVETAAAGLDDATGGYLAAVVVDSEGDEEAEPLELRTSYLYDDLGHLASVTDPRGNVTHLLHNTLGQLVEWRLPPPLRYRRWFLYDADDNLKGVRTENYRANDANFHALVTRNRWIEVDVERDLLGNAVTVRREVSGGEAGPAHSLVETLRYDPNGRLVRRSSGDGSLDETWRRDERGRVIEHTRAPRTPEEATVTWARDENGAVVLETDAADSDGDGERERTELRRDGHGRLASIIDPAGGARVFERGPGGLVERRTFLGAAGGETPTAADPKGRVLLESAWQVHDLRGQVLRRGRKLFGDGREEARSLIEELFHDAEGRLVRRRLPDGREHLFVRDAAGRVTREASPSGVVARRRYDAAGNVVELTTLETSEEVIAPEQAGNEGFDEEGRLLRRERIVHVYDQRDRRIATIDQEGATWRARYDSLDNLVLLSDAEGIELSAAADPTLAGALDLLSPRQRDNVNDHGNRVRYVYDNLGRPVSVLHEMRRQGQGGGPLDTTNPFNADGVIEVSIDWDDAGHLIGWTDDGGRRTSLEYGAGGNLRGRSFADGSSEVIETDLDGNPRYRVDRAGSVIQQRFDALHRVVERRVIRAVGVDGTTLQRFEYDGLSRPVLMADNNDPLDPEDDTLVLRVFDSLGRVLEESQDGFSFEWERDANGRAVAVRYPDGRLLETPRGPHGRISRLRDELRLYVSYARLSSGLALEKDAGGLRLSYLREDAEGVPRLVGYDPFGGIVRHAYRREGETVLGFEYGRDASGFPLWARELHRRGAPGDAWRYDSVYRVRFFAPDLFDPRTPPPDPLRKLRFTIDGSHNWRVVEVDQSRRRLTVDEANRFLDVGGETLEYDGSGNLAHAGERAYTYDAFGRLVRVFERGEPVARYAYDATGADDAFDYRGRGRRARRTLLQGVAGRPPGTRRYLYLGERLAEERGPDGGLVVQYFWEDGGRPAALLRHLPDEKPRPYLFLHDAGGSVAGLADLAGSLVENARYGLHGQLTLLNVFGNPIRSSSAGNALYFGSLVYDPETGFYSVGGRHFYPELGRFLGVASPVLLPDPLATNGYLAPGLEPVPGQVAGGRPPGRRRARLEDFARPRLLAPGGRAGLRTKRAIRPRGPAPFPRRELPVPGVRASGSIGAAARAAPRRLEPDAAPRSRVHRVRGPLSFPCGHRGAPCGPGAALSGEEPRAPGEAP